MEERDLQGIRMGVEAPGGPRKARRRWLRVVEAPEDEPTVPIPPRGVHDAAVEGRVEGAWRRGLAEVEPRPAPLIRPWPRSAMFVPIVVLVAVLPGLYALRHWDLTPPGPWWGLRGLEVLDGRLLDQAAGPSGALGGLSLSESEATAYREVALQPPLYAWLEAVGLALGSERNPLATVLPSYLAGALVVALVYLLGRIWGGPATGLLAALLTGLNRELLVQMQQATPTTLGLWGALVAVLAYLWACRREGRSEVGPGLVGGLGLGASLMTVGLFGLWLVPVVALHRLLIAPGRPRSGLPGRRSGLPGLGAAGIGLAAGLALALPWHVSMYVRHGWVFVEALLAPPHSGGSAPIGLLDRLALLAPATLAPGLLGAWFAARRVLVPEASGGIVASGPGGRRFRCPLGSTLWLAWLASALLAPAVLPSGPKPVLNLFLLVPLNLLAAGVLADLASRRLPARVLTWLAPATVAATAWWASPSARAGVRALLDGSRLEPGESLGLRLGILLVSILVVATIGLDRWAHRREGRRRAALVTYLAIAGALTALGGVREVRFRHRETGDLLMLREAIARRDRQAAFDVLAVVGPPGGPRPSGPDDHRAPAPRPGGRLRFLLRTALPDLSWVDLPTPEGLDALPPGRLLVILAGSEARLSYPSQARLGLEAIYPGRTGVLEAYATPLDPAPARIRR